MRVEGCLSPLYALAWCQHDEWAKVYVSTRRRLFILDDWHDLDRRCGCYACCNVHETRTSKPITLMSGFALLLLQVRISVKLMGSLFLANLSVRVRPYRQRWIPVPELELDLNAASG